MADLTKRETIQLADGRRVDFIGYGDPDGAPAMYLHGTPSSAREARWLHDPALAAHVRIISMDRPGYQSSDPIASPAFEKSAKVVVDVAAQLGLGRFSVIGFSGGAGSALATAAEAPGLVNSVHLGGGMGSLAPGERNALSVSRRIFFSVAANVPPVAKFLLGRMSKRMNKLLGPKLQMPTLAVLELLEGPAKGAQVSAAETFARSASEEDLQAWASEYLEGANAIDAVWGDMASLSRPWSFELSALTTPVELWHGIDDGAVPFSYAKSLSKLLPNAKLHALEGEGHFVFLTHGAEVCNSIYQVSLLQGLEARASE
jgi:pimeloyl-ACP methyl ester carboxylesterase